MPIGRQGRQVLLGGLLSKLRFPWIFGVLAGLFLLDVITPDPIPLLDETMLGILTFLVGMLRKRDPEPVSEPDASEKPPMKNVTPSDQA
jgi:hypothetical protein